MESELRQFPAIENVFQSGGLPGFLERCEETCKRLGEIAQGPEARLAERARSAMAAYGHTVDLLRRLERESGPPATSAPAAR